MKIRNCELCNQSAAVFCPSDAAFLCWSCDAKVHEANFLVARHIRQSICSDCGNLAGDGISGVGFHPFPATCNSCNPAEEYSGCDSLSSSNSSCISSTTSPAKGYSGGEVNSRNSQPPVKSNSTVNYCKLEGIFVNWSAKLGLQDDVAVRAASTLALKVCLDRPKVLPFRILVAASMWLGLKSAHTRQILKRLEEISGVAANVILAAESKLARALRDEKRQNRRRLELEEGWAEC